MSLNSDPSDNANQQPPPPRPDQKRALPSRKPKALTAAPPSDISPDISFSGGVQRWGMVDLFLTIPFLFGFVMVAVQIYQLSEFAPIDLTNPSAAFIVITGSAQQLAQFSWPYLVAKFRGLGLVRDWGFSFKWKEDIPLGAGIGIACIIIGSALSNFVARILGVNTEEASNTSILTDNASEPWIIGIILMVVIGAPVTEELLYRGLLLRILEKQFNLVSAVVLSTVIFAVVHYQSNNTFDQNLVLFASIGTVGAILGVVTARKGRLGPAIIAHFVFNSFGTVASLLSSSL